MNERPQENVSVISEMSVYQGDSGVFHFAAALGWGTLAGTIGLLSIITLTFPSGGAGQLIGGAAFLGLVVGLFTLVGQIVIGLPVTLALSMSDEEHQFLYAVLGGFSGLAVMLVLYGQGGRIGSEELLFAAPGALAGSAAAWRWGGWREAQAIARNQNPIPNPKPED